jgi:hypothetical protein
MTIHNYKKLKFSYINIIPLYRDIGLRKKIDSLIKLVFLCLLAFMAVVFWKPVVVLCMFYRDFKYETAGSDQVNNALFRRLPWKRKYSTSRKLAHKTICPLLQIEP